MFELIYKIFNENKDSNIAKGMEQYMQNKFEYFGIKSPLRKELSKPFLKTWMQDKIINYDLVLQLWQSPQREFQYVAIEYLEKMKKYFVEEDIYFFEKLVLEKSWWDSVDALASNVIGYWAHVDWKNRSLLLLRWIESENLWMNRTAIICQLKYKNDVDTVFLTESIIPHIESKEFFHRKAIGWSLRQYSKFNPDWVKKFLQTYNNLSNLSRSEASKFL